MQVHRRKAQMKLTSGLEKERKSAALKQQLVRPSLPSNPKCIKKEIIPYL
jgi:hypothetical protein